MMYKTKFEADFRAMFPGPPFKRPPSKADILEREAQLAAWEKRERDYAAEVKRFKEKAYELGLTPRK